MIFCPIRPSRDILLTFAHWRIVMVGSVVFFFQAEDGIRDRNVTGVQTCALPISAITGGAGLVAAGLVPSRAQESAKKAPLLVLPAVTTDVTPFTVHVPRAALDDLKRRLASTRWPERETVGDWSQGVPLQKAQALIAYWGDKYDWRRFEARLNAFPQYRTQI